MLYGAWLGRMTAVGAAALLTAAQPPIRAHDVVAGAYLRNRLLASYVFSVHGTMQMRTFPWVRFPLDGTGVFKRGIRYEVHFARMPFFARAFRTVDLSALSPAMWRTHYRVSFAGFDGNDGLYVLSDPTDTILRQAVVRVDPVQGIREIHLSYTNGGTIDMHIDCTTRHGYLLPEIASTRIDVPLARLAVRAAFTYREIVVDSSLGSTVR